MELWFAKFVAVYCAVFASLSLFDLGSTSVSFRIIASFLGSKNGLFDL